MKKALSLLLAFIMVLSVAAMFGVSAFAISKISSLDITGFTVPTAGDKVSDHLNIVLPDYCSIYKETSTGWFSADGKLLNKNYVFESGKEYYYRINFEVDKKTLKNKGANLADNVTLLINGAQEYVDRSRSERSSYKFELYTVKITPKTPLSTVSTINVRGFKYPTVGETASDCLNIFTSSGSGYKITTCDWMNDTDGLRMSDDDVFEAEKEYYLEMALTPLTGYEFADSVSFTFGGSNEYVDTPYCRINGSGTADMFSVTLTPKVLKTAVSSVNVNGFTVPKVGDKVSDHLSVSVPAGSGYTISHVHWYSSEFGSISDSDVFEADMDYYISIDLSPLSGYEFASDAKFYINNSEEYTDTIYSKVTADGNARLYSIDLEATSAEQAKTPVVAVNVIGFTVPNAGDRASDRLSVSVPEDSGYSILSVNWYDNENNNYLSGSDTFEAGKTYYLDITLVPLTGYQFTSGVRFYFNGSEEYVDTLYSRLQGETIMLYSIDLTPSDQASKTIIDRIDIVGFSLPYVGTSVGDAVYPTVPDDCGYRITTAHWYFGAGGWMLDGIEFEKDEEIKLCIYLEPLEGYAFSDDTEFYIDGSSALVSPGSHLNANGTAFIYTINVVAAESAKKIEVVNVLGYTEPHADDVANAYVGLTVPGDCGYVISEISWLEAESKVALSGEDKFEDGKSYFLLVKLAPSDGYVFASDPEFLIDGSDSAVDKANSLANNEYTATLLSAEISAKPEIHLSECDINGHTWGEWMQTLEPNCIYGGEQMRVCTVCDAVEKEELYPLGHSLSDQKLDPTCIESGYTRQICERCGEIFDEVEIEPLGHDFGEWLQTLEPTVGEEGEEERVCARCGETETRPLPALDPEPTTADKTTSAPEKTDPAPSGSEQTERTEKSGCDSVIGGTGVAVCMITVGAAAFLAKKKRGDK